MRILRAQIAEIRGDRALRFYGAALALVNAVTALYWLVEFPVSAVLDPRQPPVCWPFFESCDVFHRQPPAVVIGIVVGLLLGAVANAGLFASARHTQSAFWTLLILTGVKATVVFSDYRLILNQHYMAFWTVLPFLFWPSKRSTLRYLVVAFYVAAGLLKANPEWLSGDALLGRRPLGLPASLVPASCAYVLALELAIVFGMLSKRAWIFWASLAQFVLFHIASFWVVGFFYPVLMFLLLAIFPLARYLPPRDGGVGWRLALARGPRLASLSLVGLFAVLQLAPAAFPGDSSVTGEGRLFALHMFDAPIECRATATVRTEGELPRAHAMRPHLANVRIACDPIVYFNLAREYCRGRANQSPQVDLDLTLDSRKHGAPGFDRVAYIASFCTTNPTYSIWRHNAWIHPPPREASLLR